MNSAKTGSRRVLVPRIYLDSSAAAKLISEEAESEPLASFLSTLSEPPVACDLLETEVRRFAIREGLPQSLVTAVLDNVDLFVLGRSDYHEAGIMMSDGFAGMLRSLDALHLQAALRLDVDGVLTYDIRMIEAAAAIGLTVISPGITTD